EKLAGADVGRQVGDEHVGQAEQRRHAHRRQELRHVQRPARQGPDEQVRQRLLLLLVQDDRRAVQQRRQRQQTMRHKIEQADDIDPAQGRTDLHEANQHGQARRQQRQQDQHQHAPTVQQLPQRQREQRAQRRQLDGGTAARTYRAHFFTRYLKTASRL